MAVIGTGEAIAPIMRYVAKGPILGGKKRRSALRFWPILLLLGVAGLAAWLSLRVIGQDLAEGRHIHATHHDDAKPQQIAATLPTPLPPQPPGGPQTPNLPQRLQNPIAQDPVVQALLAAGRDHLARKVTAVSLPVDDPRATKGSGIDLLDRGLERMLSLRQALPRHRMLAPHLYGLREKPPANADERRRALTAENLRIFLETFAQPLSGQHDDLEAGDVVLIQRRRGVKRLLPAVVSDVVDADGTPLLMTLDPADHVAREQSLSLYRLEAHFRLHAADVERARQALDLVPLVTGGATL